eukprot:gene1299-57552_t
MWRSAVLAAAAFAGTSHALCVGDVNGDGQITSADADLLAQQLTDDSFDAGVADVNGDGEVNNNDAVAIV